MTATARDVEVDTTVWRERGDPLVRATSTGPLAGHTVAVKDLFAVAGYPIGAGVEDFLAERTPEPRHAAVVADLLAAGATITGIARTDEFAYSITGGNGRTGMPVNPAAPQCVPGGSTSGPAVAVARGEATIGLGTDTAGSIRVPGSYQGLWGIRTTHASLDTTGLLPLAPSFDTIGWLTRDPATLFAVADVLITNTVVPQNKNAVARIDIGRSPVGRDPEVGQGAAATDSEHTGLRAGELVVDPALCGAAEPGVAERSLLAAEELGARPITLRADLDRWFSAFRAVQAFEAWAGHGEWLTAHPGALEPEVGERFAWAATVTAEQATAARTVVVEAAVRIRGTIGDRVLVLPTTAGPPPLREADQRTRDAVRGATLRLTCLASIAGLPAVTLPLPDRHGLPVGLCLVGAANTDRALIHLATRCAARLANL
ncbi:amidase family protein [Nocardia sp. A7]|uniref:amidase family protein n=1 Tax=Nocardia sp. A7 TaxID=2789274 RepID=UPI00397BCCE9